MYKLTKNTSGDTSYQGILLILSPDIPIDRITFRTKG